MKKISEQRKKRISVYQSQMWRTLRLKKLNEQPVCEMCQMHAATDVHHKDSFMKYKGEKFFEVAYDYNNLMSLCARCHNMLHTGHMSTENENNSQPIDNQEIENCEIYEKFMK